MVPLTHLGSYQVCYTCIYIYSVYMSYKPCMMWPSRIDNNIDFL